MKLAAKLLEIMRVWLTKLRECLVCGVQTESEDEYCAQHQAALQNMHDSFLNWSKAYGSLSVEEFLSKLLKLRETGGRVKDVATFLTSNPERW